MMVIRSIIGGNVLTWIQQYLTYALLSVIVLLALTTTVQTVRIAIVKKEIALSLEQKKVIETQLLNSQQVIRQLAVATDELSARLRDNQAAAAKEKRKRESEHSSLGNESVPNDCKGATTWARQKSSMLSAKW